MASVGASFLLPKIRSDMCPYCAAGLHEECSQFEFVSYDGPIYLTIKCCCEQMQDTAEVVIGRQGAIKEDGDLKDVTSTGRKRAAKLKPIIEGMTCEWANLRHAGGGAIPIVGCAGTLLTTVKGNDERTGNIHHGPDKSTVNNNDENLHRVCGKCHNRWHALNDPLYPKERPAEGAAFLPLEGECLPHDKHTVASPEEVARSEAFWKIEKGMRPDFKEFVYNVTANA